MRLTDRVIDEQKKQRQEKQRKAGYQEEEDETGMAYMERPRFRFLNEDKGVFDTTDNTSLNTAPSVFERTAIFHVNREE